jgi:wyosine [tRNA(Phe)-imidazoG37] synthetase (radical SAM superfamily)
MKELVFGPVPSRRLGFSLGVDMVPKKHCTFDCIYCQVGKTTSKATERQAFIDPDVVIGQVIEKVKKIRHVDYVSLSGSGEPTLNSNLGLILAGLKKRIDLPLTVITNASLLSDEQVRRELRHADLVLPSLDAPDETVFHLINRPHPKLSFAGLIEGLRIFGEEYKGRIWLEIMLIKQINDSPQQIEMFKQILTNIRVDKIHLNTVTRPPLEKLAQEIGSLELATIADMLGSQSEVICGFGKRGQINDRKEWNEAILAILKRRSLSFDDVLRITSVSTLQAKRRLNDLIRQKKVKTVVFNEQVYYLPEGEGN